jgi:hypothetical protein
MSVSVVRTLLAPVMRRVIPSPLVQRRCACGANAHAKGEECEECKTKRVRGMQTRLVVNQPGDASEREADAVAAQTMRMSDADTLGRAPVAIQRLHAADVASGQSAPPSVEQVIGSEGQPLDVRSRTFFEPRFGCDFSRVRVHHDASSAQSARDVSARAYTVGSHIVFGTGEYAPQSMAGRELLAHELSHVVQQRAVVQRDSISVEPRLAGHEAEEDEEAPVQLLQRQTGDDLFAGPWPEKDEAARIRAEADAERECLEAAGPDPDECDPARSLTWADFAGTPGGGTFSAMTFSGLRERAINVGTLRCRPDAPDAAGLPSRAIQAFMDPAQSWVRPQFANASDPAQNGCATQISGCEADIGAGSTGIHMLTTPSRTCPAGVTPRGDSANTVEECTTVLGADCNDRAVAESARLLQHEQGHFDLTCAMAQKANGMLTGTTNFSTLLSAAQRTLATQQNRYDTQTNHGCNASQQSTWESDIAAGLPAVTITLTAPRARRRR